MNKQDRKQVAVIANDAQRVYDLLESFRDARIEDPQAEQPASIVGLMEGVESALSDLDSNEQDKLSNLSEGQLAGPMGERLQETADQLQEAYSTAGELLDEVRSFDGKTDADDISAAIDTAETLIDQLGELS